MSVTAELTWDDFVTAPHADDQAPEAKADRPATAEAESSTKSG
jgi:hypothetical protein